MLSLDVFESFLFFNNSNATRDPVDDDDGSLVCKCSLSVWLGLAAAMLRMFGSDNECSGLAGVYTFKSSDRYFGYAAVIAVWHRVNLVNNSTGYW